MSIADTDVLAELIVERHRCLSALYALSQSQSAAIGRGDMSELLRILEVKQRSLAAWQYVERQLDPYRDQDPGQRQWRDARLQQRCARLLAECEQLLPQMILLEQTCDAELRARRDVLAEQMQHVHSAQAVRSAYAQSASGVGATLDLRTDP